MSHSFVGFYFRFCLENIKKMDVKKGKNRMRESDYFLLKLLLGADVVGVTAGLLAAVGGARGEAGVALTADLLVPVVLLGEGDEGGFHDTTAEFEFKFKFAGHFLICLGSGIFLSRGLGYVVRKKKREKKKFF